MRWSFCCCQVVHHRTSVSFRFTALLALSSARRKKPEHFYDRLTIVQLMLHQALFPAGIARDDDTMRKLCYAMKRAAKLMLRNLRVCSRKKISVKEKIELLHRHFSGSFRDELRYEWEWTSSRRDNEKNEENSLKCIKICSN